MKISVEVNCCDECPYAYITKVWTADSFEDIRRIKCKKSEEIVYNYLEWHDKSPVPDRCPFNS